MPELPEVQVLVNQLTKKITSLTIKQIDFLRQENLKSSAPDIKSAIHLQKILKIKRRGKFFGLVVSSGKVLWFHLGMTGQILFGDLKLSNEKHVQCKIYFQETNELLMFHDIRRFGKIFLESGSIPNSLLKLGPEPFDITPQDFVNKFKSRSGRIKSLLLNQSLVAGLGNIYADESLFRAKIDPRKRANKIKISDLSLLHKTAQEVLKQAIEAGGSSIDDFRHVNGESGRYQNNHQVYGKTGKPCAICKTSIRRVFLAGRSTHFCPACQTQRKP